MKCFIRQCGGKLQHEDSQAFEQVTLTGDTAASIPGPFQDPIGQSPEKPNLRFEPPLRKNLR